MAVAAFMAVHDAENLGKKFENLAKILRSCDGIFLCKKGFD